MQEQACINFDAIPPSQDEAVVLSMLRPGREHAVSSTIIEERTGLKPRRVQAIVRELRLSGNPIGSAVTDPKGYYIITDQEELAEMYRGLLHRAVSLMVVVSKARRQSLDMTFDQAKIALEAP